MEEWRDVNLTCRRPCDTILRTVWSLVGSETIESRRAMIQHIVMWKLRENAKGIDKTENALEMVSRLKGLQDRIPEIVHFEVGRNISPSEASYDVALVSSFVHREDLNRYQVHPEHIKVVDFIGSVAECRAVVDYEV